MLAKKPPMGFNTWNTFGENINEKIILETADKMVELGLRDAGYEYLVIDDCWSEHERDPETGRLVPDHVKFPNGMKYVSDYVHSKGLKFGMYSDVGVYTCAGYPASFDHEFLDAKTFADFGADYLKYDYGYKPASANGEVLYRRMAQALRNCGRDIVLSACQWGCDDPHLWMRSAGADLYRSTGDIEDTWESLRNIIVSQLDKLCCAGPGLWNDTDMLTIGMRGRGNVGEGRKGCTDTEYETEFALWCMIQAPLMIGADLRGIDDVNLALLKNERLIRINQDEDARPPYVFRHGEYSFVLVKLLSDGEMAISMTNGNDGERHMCFFMEDLGLPVSSGLGLDMTDAFTGENVGYFKEIFRAPVPAHGTKCYICTVR
ncbi:MAG: glycoside hydrolase family 27 protein [Clostridia bacterium]|nr:glycoside hydrolase family 27 protein [Clostridia bacterium]